MSYHSFSGKNGIQQTMAEPLKNLYNKKLTSNLSNEIVKHYPAFDQRTFDLSVFDNCWKGRQLKQRIGWQQGSDLLRASCYQKADQLKQETCDNHDQHLAWINLNCSESDLI